MNLINAFHELAKINKVNLELKASMDPYYVYSQKIILDKIVKDWDLKMMLNFASSSKKNQTLMEPIIKKKKEELESYVEFLNNLGRIYTIEVLDQEKTLSLNNNQLKTVPNFNLPMLQELYLNNNQLTSVPDFNLPKLQALYLNNNQLTTVPDFNLLRLQILYLSSNQLTNKEKEKIKKTYKNKVII